MTNSVWIGQSGDWNDSTQWDVTGQPATVDTNVFDTSSAISVTGYGSTGILQLEGCNLTLDGFFSDQTRAGEITDALTPAGMSNSLTLTAEAQVETGQLALTNTNLVVNGGLLVDRGSVSSLTLTGPEALLGVNNDLSVGSLALENGAVFAGNISLGAGSSINVDDQSTIGDGTIYVAGPSTIYVSSTNAGASEAVQLSGNITLENNSTLTISGDAGVTVDLTGNVAGAGTLLTPGSNVAVDGTLTAVGGTLSLANVMGTGTLQASSGSDLVLQGYTDAGLTASFSSNATLTLQANLAWFSAQIANFAPTDSLILPASGATQADFVASANGAGVLTLLDGETQLAHFNLSGVQSGEAFHVSDLPSGQTLITASVDIIDGIELGTSNNASATGALQPSTTQIEAAAPSATAFIQQLVNEFPGGDNEWYLAGDTKVVATAPDFGFDIEIVGALGKSNPSGYGPGSNVVLASGYHALIALGHENVNLFDNNNGNSLLVGNAGSDTLLTTCGRDTLVGATGANTTFYASSVERAYSTTIADVIQGGGNDTITIDNSDAVITTSAGSSKVYLTSGQDTVSSQGHDEIVCGGGRNLLQASVSGGAHDSIFGGATGLVDFTGGSGSATVVGAGGDITMTGGSENGNLLWAGESQATYVGGQGSALVVGGTGNLDVQGGEAPVTVWAGTGGTVINGTAGNSLYVVGDGAASINAGAGNAVWIDGSSNVSVTGAAGVIAYGAHSAGNDLFQAASGSETLWGGTGDDTFVAGDGNSFFVAGSGHDVFSFANGQATGQSEILDFVQGLDTISFSGYGDETPSVSVHNGSSFINLGNGSQVEVFGVTNMTSAAFHVV